jgi:putative spermidine/putrescine transport system substrate-binding protein
MRINKLLVGLGLATGVVVASVASAQTEPPKPAQIVINDSGGDMQATMRRIFYSEFEKRYGIRVVNTSPADLGKLRAMVQSGNVEWAVTEIGGEDAQRAEESGLLEPLDRSIIDLSKFPKHLHDRKYVFPEGKRPQSWADFWDVQRFPGPRTMRNAPFDNLEFALLADGVPLDKLYPLDIDRAFRKLDQIKKHVAAWWTTGAQSAQLLVDKEAVLGTAWNGRYYAAIKEGAPLAIEWNGGGIKESAFAIPKGAKDAYWGQKFLALATDAKLQGLYANIIGYPGLNLEAINFTDPKVAPFLPTHPDHISKQFWTDIAWWNANAAAVTERWQRWMLQK